MRIPVVECIAGTTIRVTWVSSGVVPSGICSNLLSGSETLVQSVGGVESGDGHYHALHRVPTSGGWYINRWYAAVAANTYESRQLVRSMRLEAD